MSAAGFVVRRLQFTYEPGGCNHAPSRINGESQEEHTANQGWDDQDHGHKDSVFGEQPASKDTDP